MNPFTHLHTHSMYSFSDGMSKVPDLVNKALALGMPAIALTDHGGMYGIMELFAYCAQVNARRREQGEHTILPIAGCEVYVSSKHYHLVLLAKNLQGYHNLCKISSSGYFAQRLPLQPIVEWETIEQYHEGLICLSACIGGELAQTILHGGNAEEVVLRHKALFGEDYYIEVQRHKTDKENACTETYELQQKIEPVLLWLAHKYDIKVVATNDSHFLNEEDADAHDALLQYHYGRPNKPVFHFSKQEWFKSQEEMAAAFADIPETLRNTQEVVNKIEAYTIVRSTVQLPVFPLPKGFRNADEYLQHLVAEGIKKHLPQPVSKEIDARVRYELNVFLQKGSANYLLIWWDIIRACREELDVWVGVGRAAAPSSVVLYCLGITDVNPLDYGLLSERFYNLNTKLLPDIDIAVAESGRQRVLDYIRQKYGENAVCPIITHFSWSKLRAPRPQFEGLYNQHSVHNSGIVIAPSNCTDYIPVAKIVVGRSRETAVVTQYDRRGIASAGLVQFNIAGWKVLDQQWEVCRLLREEKGIVVDFCTIPLDDTLTLEIYRQENRNGIVGFENAGLTPYLLGLKNLTFDDLIVLYAMYRPGAKEQLDTYVRRRNGEETIPSVLLGAADTILAPTCGIPVFQEQLMAIGQQVAGFSREESDLLRKAINRRTESMLNRLHTKFVDGGVSKGYESAQLERFWLFLDKKGMYAYLKAHAVAITLQGYRLAYLKAHYPEIFCCVFGVTSAE